MEGLPSRERAGPAFLAQQDIRLDIPDSGQSHDPASQHTLEIREIAGDDPKTEVIETQHMLHGLHLRNRGYRALELLKPGPALRGEFNPKKHRNSKPQSFEVHLGSVTPDSTIALQPPDTSPCGRLAQTEAPSQGACGLGGVFRQCKEKTSVKIVQYNHIGSRSCSLTVATCINASISEICGSVRIRSR